MLAVDKDRLHTVATRKVMFRLIPLMVAIYFLSFLDRTNIGMAKMALQTQLGIGPAAYRFGAGIFFWGYALLEVPSNLIGHKVGPRRWLARIAVTWGAIAACMMFVQGDRSFYILRLLLGIAEAGLFPLLMYFTTLWFAQKDRAVAVGWIYIAPSAGLMIGNPIGGLLLQLHGLGGLQGWQWMFLLEGIPTVILGIILWFVFPDRPTTASWLTKQEAEILEERAVGEQKHAPRSMKWLPALTSPITLLMGIIYFLNQVGFVGLYFSFPRWFHRCTCPSPLMVGLMASTVGIGFLLGVLTLPWIQRLVKGDVPVLGNSDWLRGGGLGLVHSPSAAQRSSSAFRREWLFCGRHIADLLVCRDEAVDRNPGRGRSRVHQHHRTDRRVRRSVLVRLGGSAHGHSASGFSIILITAIIGLALIPFWPKRSAPRIPEQ